MTRSLAVCVGVLLLLAAPVCAQTRLEVRVTSVADRSVYINKGRDDGVGPDMIVIFFTPDGGQVRAVVRDISSGSARAELFNALPAPTPGMTGEIVLPAAAPTAGAADGETAEVEPKVEHPPWTREEGARDPDAPLLAPAYGRRPEDQPTKIRGRFFTNLRYSTDAGGDRDNSSAFGRLGARLDVTNPFKKGGTIGFSGSLDYRGVDALSTSNSDLEFRVDRLSYAWGEQDYAPYRIEAGRFFSVYVPELGLIDGAEGAMRLENGLDIGAGAAFYPEPFPERSFGNDYGYHVFANYQSTGDSMLSTGIAYQQTWHDGEQDRNLVVARINARPVESLWVYGLAMVDIYTNSDSVKGSGVELTQGIAQLRYTPDRVKGGQFTFTRTTYPELLRGDFGFVPPELIRDGFVDRLNASAWVRVHEDVRLTGRANAWQDQDSTGNGAELNVDWNDVWRDTSALHAGLFFTEGSSLKGYGTRLLARERFNDVSVSAGYDTFFYEPTGLAVAGDSFARHTFRADVGWGRGRWYYNLNGSYTLGDLENQVSLALFAEYRF